jgi:hypothetical protein
MSIWKKEALQLGRKGGMGLGSESGLLVVVKIPVLRCRLKLVAM